MDPKAMQAVGAAVRAARDKMGLTQAEAAERCGLSTEVYGRVERGITNFSIDSLIRFCSALTVDANIVLGLRGPDGAWAGEPPPEYKGSETPEVRRLLRGVKHLDKRFVRILAQLVELIVLRVSRKT
jgi:transcriptional regulator with XRE-family HTH domain